MPSQTISTLKSYFETGDVPTEAQFADLIDSCVNLKEPQSIEANWDVVGNNTLFVDRTNGRVGIGSGSPSSEFQVRDTSGDNKAVVYIGSGDLEQGVLYLFGDNANSGASLYMYNSANEDDIVEYYNIVTEGVGLLIRRTTEVDLCLGSSGNFGIGTNSPSRKLDVVGGSGTFKLASTDTNSTNKVAFYLGRHYNNVEQDIGWIYTISTATQNILYIGGSDPGNGLNGATHILFYTATDNITLGESEKMRIDSAGNVGIGNTSPTHKLDIVGTYTSQLQLTDSVTNSTPKNVSMNMKHYTSAQKIAIFWATSQSTYTTLSIGGGSAGAYAVTSIVFRTAPDNTTINGTDRVLISGDGGLGLKDGITAPATLSGWALLYVDAADGDLKIKFGDGTIKTIVVDT